MKKQLLLSALLLTATSAMADPIDLQKAKAIAADYLSENIAEPTLVKRATRDEAKARRMPAKTAQAAPYYIFSRGEGQGFVIVSGDDCLPDVLGYTESGDFIEDQMPPQLLGWLDAWAKSIEETQVRGENVSRSSDARKANYTAGGIRKAAAERQDVPVLLTSQWHQTWPYNSWCPYIKNTSNRAVVGCVATAGSQVLYYFRKDLPELLGATTPTYDWCDAPVTQSIPKGTPMKWGLMLDSYGNGYPDEYYDAIGLFNFVVGAYSWMGYGASSGAFISDLCPTFNDCFNVSSKNIWAGHSTLQGLAYDDLIQKRPVVYAGYDNSDMSQAGGHAIVIDGYRARDDKYHFNFGWGGGGPESGGNGWYIMEDEGVGGYGFNPSITYNIDPKAINVSAAVSAPQGFYANHENKIRVTLKNKSTFPLEGVYLFEGPTNSTPTSLTSASSSVIQTIPNDGSTVDIYLTAKPSTENTHYVVITDEKLHVLARQPFEAVTMGNDLRFRGLEVMGSMDTETHSGHVFTFVNGTYIDLAAKIMNASNYTYEESPRIQILTSDDDGETFKVLGTKKASDTKIDALSEGEFRFSFDTSSSVPIVVGNLYAARLMDPLTTSTQSTVTYESGESVVYFIPREAEKLTAKLEGTSLKFTGDWNVHTFEQKVNLRSNASATVFDLTEVKGVSHVPVLSGKEFNLILVNDDAVVEGVNVVNVVTGQADRLSLAVGHGFNVPVRVHAASVSMKLNATPGVWKLVTVPCDFTVPDGVMAKRIDTHTSTGITNKTTNVTSLEAGHTYLMITASDHTDVLTATDVDLLTEPQTNVDEAVVGTFTGTTAPEGAFYIDAAGEYFTPATEAFDVEAFGGFFQSSTNTRAFRCSSTLTMDNAYLLGGQSIANAYGIYEKYADYTTAEATEELLAAIHAFEAVYTSRSAETSEVRTLTKSLDELAAAYALKLDPEKLTSSLDVTFLIVNPSFERGYSSTSTNGTTYGWTAGSNVSVRKNDQLSYRAVGADGNFFVCTNMSATTPNNGLSQTIENLPEGLYALTAMLGTDVGQTVTFYANEQEATVGASPSGVYYLQEARISDILITEGQALTIGVRDGDWYKADDFHLYYIRPLTDEEKMATSITVMKEEPKATGTDDIYDLQGRKLPALGVSSLDKGIYIIGGKKVLVK